MGRNETGKRIKPLLYGFLIMALFVELFVFAWARVQCVQIGYETANAWEERKALLEQQEMLKAQVAYLQSPRRIMQIGKEQFGLSMPRPGQVVVVANEMQ